jgi:hypothetical protein
MTFPHCLSAAIGVRTFATARDSGRSTGTLTPKSFSFPATTTDREGQFAAGDGGPATTRRTGKHPAGGWRGFSRPARIAFSLPSSRFRAGNFSRTNPSTVFQIINGLAHGSTSRSSFLRAVWPGWCAELFEGAHDA